MSYNTLSSYNIMQLILFNITNCLVFFKTFLDSGNVSNTKKRWTRSWSTGWGRRTTLAKISWCCPEEKATFNEHHPSFFLNVEESVTLGLNVIGKSFKNILTSPFQVCCLNVFVFFLSFVWFLCVLVVNDHFVNFSGSSVFLLSVFKGFCRSCFFIRVYLFIHPNQNL